MHYVIGVDEAGRGPLAGPVVVGIVCARKEYDFKSVFPHLHDSKKVTPRRREVIVDILKREVEQGRLSYLIKSVSARDIDRHGITTAVRVAVHAGVEEIALGKNVHVYLDGLLHAPAAFSQETIEGGDALIPSIMLASVAAKVARDHYMEALGERIPEYGFKSHKGYGTKAHIEAIRTHGLSSEHRKSFCTRISLRTK